MYRVRFAMSVFQNAEILDAEAKFDRYVYIFVIIL